MGVLVEEPAWVTDTREVRLRISGAPLLYTPRGKSPIEPYHVELVYDIADREEALRSIVVLGRTADDPARRRHTRRRVELNDAPGWLADLVEEYLP